MKTKFRDLMKGDILKGVSRNVIALGFVSFFTDMSSEMIYPLLPVFLGTTLAAGPAFLGIIEGIAESTASILKLYSGGLSDRLKRRRVLVLGGYTLSAIARPLVALATSWLHVLIVRFSDRVGKGIRNAPRDALLAHTTSEKNRGKAFGFQRGMDHLGAALGPLIAIILLAFVQMDGMGSSLRMIFALAAIPGILGVLTILFGVKEYRPDEAQPAPALKLTGHGFSSKFKTYLVIVVLFTLGNSSDMFLLWRAGQVMFGEMGKPQVPMLTLLPAFWLVLHLSKVIFAMPGGMLSDKLGRRPVIILGWIVYALVYVGFGFASSPTHVWILFAVYGLYFGLTEGAEKAFVADMVKPHMRGTAYGLYNFAIGIAALPASVIFGIIYWKAGATTAFLFGACLALLSSLLIASLGTFSRD